MMLAVNSTLPAASREYERPTRIVAAYFSLELFTFLSLVPLLWTFVSGRVKRDATISSLILVFMAVSWGMSIMFLSGTLTGPNEDVKFGVCLANAAIVYGTSPAQSLAALNIVLRIVIRIIASKGRWTTFCDSKGLTICLLASPWVVWIIYISSALSIGLKDRSKVFRAVLYCAIDNETLVDGTTIFTAIINVVTIVLEVSVAIILCRQFLTLRSFRKAAAVSTGVSNQSSSTRSFTLGGASLPLILRLGVFGLCVILALICSVVTQGDFTAVASDFSIACIGSCVIFIFGSQGDVLKAWHIKSQTASHTSHSGPAVVSTLNANPNTSRGIMVTSETYVMDSIMPRVNRDTDLESNDDRISGSEVDIGWGSQVALRKEDVMDSKGGNGDERSGSSFGSYKHDQF